MNAKVFAELLYVLLRHVEKMPREDRLQFEASILNIGGGDYNSTIKLINNLRLDVENWINSIEGPNVFALYLSTY